MFIRIRVVDVEKDESGDDLCVVARGTINLSSEGRVKGLNVKELMTAVIEGAMIGAETGFAPNPGGVLHDEHVLVGSDGRAYRVERDS